MKKKNNNKTRRGEQKVENPKKGSHLHNFSIRPKRYKKNINEEKKKQRHLAEGADNNSVTISRKRGTTK